MKGKKYLLKTKILSLLMFSWLLPVLLMIFAFAYYVISHHYQNVNTNLMDQLEYSVELCTEKVEKCADVSRQATYDQVIMNAYKTYCRETNRTNAYPDFRRKVYNYLSQKYRRSDYFKSTTFFMFDNISKNSSVYNQDAGGSERTINTLMENDAEELLAFAKILDTEVGFYECNDRLYMVRNMMNASFQTIGVLVMHINDGYIFGSLYSMPWVTSLNVEFAERINISMGDSMDEELLERRNELDGLGHIREDGKSYIYYTGNKHDYKINAIMEADREVMMSPFYGYPFMIVSIVIVMIPLIIIFIRTYQKDVNQPIEELMRGAGEIAKGNYGICLEKNATSVEFGYLEDSFNQMSVELKRQFDRIYEEEIAIRDARMRALQSHINPHFMNNTLEIINWEARLCGDIKVSKMIEALGTLMDAAVDRNKRATIRLSEELIYVNSYLYITSERLGKRLKVEKNLPDEIMDIMVPRLILQPVIENAIEHGIIPIQEGTVSIQGYCDDEFLYLDIINDGTLTPEDQIHIQKLLDNDYDTSRESFGSMGMANVNQRLKIIYGQDCGLTMENLDDFHVRARLKIRKDVSNIQNK